MGVYIDMEMPANCCQCRFFAWTLGIGHRCSVASDITFHATIKDGIDAAYERNGGCPLVPVPPHGRLIDADKLCLSSGFSTATEYGRGRSDQIEAIKSNAPTIIPAEEGE